MHINNKMRKINKKEKNPTGFLFYVVFLYRWIIFYYYKTYYVFFKRPDAVVFSDPTTTYINYKKTYLLDSFKKEINMNKNIEYVFYDKDCLQKLLLDKDNELEKIWKARILFENSPRGNIIMFYDVYKQGFAYYSDANGIPYSVLNAVAMKYVVTFQCRDFFMDNEYLTDKNESPLIKIHLIENEKEKKNTLPIQNKKDLPFAKLKNYRVQELKNNDDKSLENYSEKKVEKEYNRNIFINLGRVSNFSFLQKKIKSSKTSGFYSKLLDGIDVEVQNQPMNYSDYKKSLMNLKKEI
jgi:hypothetical protein